MFVLLSARFFVFSSPSPLLACLLACCVSQVVVAGADARRQVETRGTAAFDAWTDAATDLL